MNPIRNHHAAVAAPRPQRAPLNPLVAEVMARMVQVAREAGVLNLEGLAEQHGAPGAVRLLQQVEEEALIESEGSRPSSALGFKNRPNGA